MFYTLVPTSYTQIKWRYSKTAFSAFGKRSFALAFTRSARKFCLWCKTLSSNVAPLNCEIFSSIAARCWMCFSLSELALMTWVWIAPRVESHASHQSFNVWMIGPMSFTWESLPIAKSTSKCLLSWSNFPWIISVIKFFVTIKLFVKSRNWTNLHI